MANVENVVYPLSGAEQRKAEVSERFSERVGKLKDRLRIS
jgi:hypothetical protein